MASRQNFRIELDDQPAFHGGYAATQRAVTGIVVLLNNQAKTCDRITVTLRGCAFVEWSVGRDKTRRGYRSSEDYVNETIVLWNVEGVPDRRLVPGEYGFPFRFVLPDHLPSSFEGAHGYIRYTLEATLYVPTLFGNTRITVDVKVLSGASEHVMSQARPAFATIEERLFPSPVPLLLNATLPRSSYSVGERIPFRACLANDSSGRATRLRAALIRVEKYRARGRGIHSFREAETQVVTRLGAVESEEIGARSVFEWSDSRLTVPSVIPNTAHCGNICLRYSVLFEIIISWTNKNAFVEIPITLSHIVRGATVEPPLQAAEFEETYPSYPSLPTAATAPPYDQLEVTPGSPHHNVSTPL